MTSIEQLIDDELARVTFPVRASVRVGGLSATRADDGRWMAGSNYGDSAISLEPYPSWQQALFAGAAAQRLAEEFEADIQAAVGQVKRRYQATIDDEVAS